MASIGGSTFNVSGLISGLDTDSIITQLMAIEKAPVTQLETKKTTVTNQLTAWMDLNTRIQAVSIQTNRIAEDSNYDVRTATSSDTDILEATASSGKDNSSNIITVKALSQAHQVVSQSYSSADDKIGTGTYTISVGTGKFAPITVDDSNNSLTGLKDAINNGSYGVTAKIVKSGDDDYRLILSSKTEGVNGAITVDSTLSGGTEPTFSTLQEAQDAHIVLGTGENALDIYRSSNVISDVIDGVTLKLKEADPENPITVSLASNTSSVRSMIDNFITQFNGLVDYFDDQFAYDATTGKTGTLFSNTSLLQVKNDIYSAVTDTIAGGSKYHSLRDMGISLDSSGKLFVADEATLSAALEDNLEEVKNTFSNESYGIGVRVKNYITQITDPITGILNTTEEYFNSDISDIEDEIDAKNEYLDRLETKYQEKFANLESALAELQQQSNQISAQIEAMTSNKSSSSSSSKSS